MKILQGGLSEILWKLTQNLWIVSKLQAYVLGV